MFFLPQLEIRESMYETVYKYMEYIFITFPSFNYFSFKLQIFYLFSQIAKEKYIFLKIIFQMFVCSVHIVITKRIIDIVIICNYLIFNSKLENE